VSMLFRSGILLGTLLAAIGLAVGTPAAFAAGTPQAASQIINYSAQLSGQITADTYLGSDFQGYNLHFLTIDATLNPQGNSPPLAVHLNVSEAFYPNDGTQDQQDVLPNGGTVSTTGFLRGEATVTNTGGTIKLYVENTSGLNLEDGSMHFDVEGTGTGQASGGKTSLYLKIDPAVGEQLTGQVSGTLDIPQAALDLITSTDPLVGPTVWYILRASGLAALFLLAASVLIGLALRVRLWKETLERWRVYDVHLTCSVLTGVFLAVHLVLVFLDRIVPFSLADMLIPLHDSYQPIWIAAGILGFYLLLVVWGSSLIRARLGYSLWRKLHPLALGALGLVMLHALFAGTDGSNFWLRMLLVFIVIAVIWLFNSWMQVREVENRRRKPTPPRQPPGRPQPVPQRAARSQSFAPGYVPVTNPPTRRPPPETGWRETPGGQPRSRRVSQE